MSHALIPASGRLIDWHPFTDQYPKSERGHVLIRTQPAPLPANAVILTCEDYIKWYQLYLFHTDAKGEIDAIGNLQFHEIEELLGPGYEPLDGPVQGDHCVNPDAVEEFCRRFNVVLPTTVDYMIRGMWWSARR